MISVKEFHVKYGRLPTENDSDWLMELAMAIANSRIQILEAPVLSPGRCCVCGDRGGDRKRKFVDVGLEIEDTFGPHKLTGTVYWCTICITELLKVLQHYGLFDHLKETVEVEVEKEVFVTEQIPVVEKSGLTELLQGLRDQMEELIDQVGSIKDGMGSWADYSSNSGGSATATVSAESDSKESTGTEPGLDGSERKSDEPDSGGEPERLHSVSQYIKPRT